MSIASRFVGLLAIFVMPFAVQGQVARPKPPSVPIARETIPIAPGGPFCSRTPVQRPIPIKGVTTWSIETRQHRGVVYHAAASPDGKLLATGGLDGAVRLWNLQTGELVKVLVGHDYYVFHLAWSPDGSTLASAGSFDATARLWDVASGQPLRAFKHPNYVSRVAWSPDGHILLVGGGESGKIAFWNVTSGGEVAKLDVGRPLTGVAWSPDGRTIAVGCTENPVQLIDVSAYKIRGTAGIGLNEGAALAWTPDSNTLAISSSAGTRLWSEESKDTLLKLKLGSTSLALSPDGQTLATTLSGGAIQLWNVADGVHQKALTAAGIYLDWSDDGGTIFSYTTVGGTAWDVAEAKSRFALDFGGFAPETTWTSTGKLVICGEGTASVSVFDAMLGKSFGPFVSEGTIVSASALSPTGKVLATGSRDKQIRIWDVAGGKQLHTLTGHNGPITALAFAANGKTLASGSDDKEVKLWNAQEGTLEHTVTGHENSVTTLAWSSRALASGGSDQNVLLINPQTGAMQKKLPVFHPVLSIAWSPDGKHLATGTTDLSAIVWNPGTGEALKRLDRAGSPRSVSAVAWAPVLPLLISGRGNHTLQVWDLRTDKVATDIRTYAPCTGAGAGWTSDGKLVVASTQDRTVRSWDAVGGGLASTVVGTRQQVAIITASGHYRILPADAVDDELVYVVQTFAGQETLSPAEFFAKYRFKNQPFQAKFPAG